MWGQAVPFPLTRLLPAAAYLAAATREWSHADNLCTKLNIWACDIALCLSSDPTKLKCCVSANW